MIRTCNLWVLSSLSLILVVGCKFESEKTTVKGADAHPQTTYLHGKLVPISVKNEILMSLDKSTSSPSSTVIVNDSQGVNSGTTLGLSEFGLQTGDAYIERCRAAGVPIPPPWGDARWKMVRQLQEGRIFALDPNLSTTLFSYQDPKVAGTCAALPRLAGATIEALGIICQAKSGLACFWDNKERTVQLDSNGERFQQTITDPASIKPELIANGDNLVENCSACHRGSNVFILHHEDLQKLPESSADKPYVPITDQPAWKNQLLDKSKVPACAGCHDQSNQLGKLDRAYCDTVMMPSIQSERQEWNPTLKKIETVDIHKGKKPPMPPAGEDPSAFVSDIAYIKDTCRNAVESAGEFWSWD